MDSALSGATTPGQSGPGSNVNKGVLYILQSSSITGTSPSDCLVSYLGHSLQGLTPLQRCSRCILQPLPTGKICIVALVFVCITEIKSANIFRMQIRSSCWLSREHSIIVTSWLTLLIEITWSLHHKIPQNVVCLILTDRFF